MRVARLGTFVAFSALALLGSLTTACKSEVVTVKVVLENEDVVLENGLRVIVHREPAWKSAVVDIRYRVGSRQDPLDRTGLAHLVEHLLFRGTRDLPGQAFDDEIESIAGGHFNAFTKTDATEYYEHVAPTDVPRALFVEAQRMAFPLHGVGEADFSAERNVVENERRERRSGVREEISDLIRQALFPSPHPYGRSTIGAPADLARATLGDATTFVKNYYRPDAATLLVVGNVDVASTLDAIAKAFAKIPNPPVLPPYRAPVAPPPPLDADVRRDVRGPTSTRALLVAWVTPAPATPDAFVLRFVQDYLQVLLDEGLVLGAQIAKKVRVIVHEQDLASVLYVEVSGIHKGESERALSILDTALSMLTQTDRLWAIGAWRSHRMLHMFREIMLPVARAEYMQDALARTGRPDTVELDLLSTQAVTIAEVARVAGAVLVGRHRAIVRVFPEGDAP